MQGRRITALLLTAFLVAQLLWRWQYGAIAPASSLDSGWSEVASGAYVASGNFLVPEAQGQVLRHSGQGWVQAGLSWYAKWSGLEVDVFGQGSGQIAVARTKAGTKILPRYGGGFLLRDPQQNLWLVQRERVKLLLGGGQGTDGRQAFMDRVASLRQQGAVPAGWQPVWAADPLPVGNAVWYLSNRDGQPGVTAPHVFRLQGKEDGPFAALTPLGNLRLLTVDAKAVVAADATGTLLRIDQASGTVLLRRADLLVLATGADGRLAVLRSVPVGKPALEVTSDGIQTMARVQLAKGVQPVGDATFSLHGHWLAFLARGPQGLVVGVARLDGRGALQAQSITPPAGTQIDPTLPVSVCGGVLYLSTRQGKRVETWSRPLGTGAPLAFADILQWTRDRAWHG